MLEGNENGIDKDEFSLVLLRFLLENEEIPIGEVLK